MEISVNETVINLRLVSSGQSTSIINVNYSDITFIAINYIYIFYIIIKYMYVLDNKANYSDNTLIAIIIQ